METKQLIELYKQLLELFKEQRTSWICNAIKLMNVSDEDKTTLKEHFFTQFPSETQYSEIYNEPSFNKRAKNNDSTDIWFHFLAYIKTSENNEINFKLRIKLIEAIINNLENSCI